MEVGVSQEWVSCLSIICLIVRGIGLIVVVLESVVTLKPG